MRKTLVTLLALSALVGNTQDFKSIVSKEYVDQLIKTISSDEMGGRAVFTPGIEKAGAFISAEFQKAGLVPIQGETTFYQNFEKFELAPKGIQLSFDYKTVDQFKAFAFGASSADAKLNPANAKLIRIKSDDNFMQEFSKILREKGNSVVLIDKSLNGQFDRFYSRMANRADVSDKLEDPKNLKVFVLDEGSYAANTFEVILKYSVTPKRLFNIAGMIPGKSKSKEAVVYSGHFDHLGIIKPVNGDSIANGADDDASGVTAVISLAKYFGSIKNNERTLIFVAFTEEETGGGGSKYFSQKLNPDDVIAMFNIEMIGKPSVKGSKSAFITGFEKSNFGEILQKNLKKTEFTFFPDPYPQQQLFYRSDNATLAKLGVPAHSISTDQIDSDKLYHSVDDEYESLDVDNIYNTIHAIALSSSTLVSGKDTPKRIKKVEEKEGF